MPCKTELTVTAVCFVVAVNSYLLLFLITFFILELMKDLSPISFVAVIN